MSQSPDDLLAQARAAKVSPSVPEELPLPPGFVTRIRALRGTQRQSTHALLLWRNAAAWSFAILFLLVITSAVFLPPRESSTAATAPWIDMPMLTAPIE